jgi:hypothetical protein
MGICGDFPEHRLVAHPIFQTELLRLARTNFSESFQILVHLKVIRLFVESVLRYGLPAEYIGIIVEVSLSIVFSNSDIYVLTCYQTKKSA